jgi:hypothetical protein
LGCRSFASCSQAPAWEHNCAEARASVRPFPSWSLGTRGNGADALAASRPFGSTSEGHPECRSKRSTPFSWTGERRPLRALSQTEGPSGPECGGATKEPKVPGMMSKPCGREPRGTVILYVPRSGGPSML